MGSIYAGSCSGPEGLYGAARKSDNERNRNALKHSTCSHKWWEILKGSIFGVKFSIPALRGTGGGLVVAPAEKASLLGSQFDRKQCREQFVTALSCFAQSRYNSLHLRLLLDLHSMGVLKLWVCYLYF